uniref:Uncharacterized protein n=1 Tax=Polysiphonia sp. TaxID=1967842 RepID=A0A1Z1MT03_9FLOR|nr:hypothetical protein [Polysiphonia sp.]
MTVTYVFYFEKTIANRLNCLINRFKKSNVRKFYDSSTEHKSFDHYTIH